MGIVFFEKDKVNKKPNEHNKLNPEFNQIAGHNAQWHYQSRKVYLTKDVGIVFKYGGCFG
jgi:hypothetical protein